MIRRAARPIRTWAFLCAFSIASSGQTLVSNVNPPESHRFAGHVGRLPRVEGDFLAGAAIPGKSSQAYLFEPATGKLFLVDFELSRRTELPLDPPLSDTGTPSSFAVDKDGTIYLPAPWKNCVYRITPQGAVSTYAGTCGGSALESPHSAQLDLATGNLYVAGARLVYRISPQRTMVAVAGCLQGCTSFSGQAMLTSLTPQAIALDARSNLYVSSERQLFVVGTTRDIVEINLRPDPADAKAVTFFSSRNNQNWAASGLAVLPDGTIAVSQASHHAVLRIGRNGYTSVTVGNPETCKDGYCGGYRGNGPLNGSEVFSSPGALSITADGRLLIVDRNNVSLRLLNPGESLQTVAGRPLCCFNEEGIPAAEATIHWPRGLATDRDGNVYVADPVAGRVRRIDTNGRITTILGNGSLTTRDGDRATETGAQPYSVAVDSKGNVYVAEPGLQLVRWVDTNGFVHTLSGPREGTFSTLNLKEYPAGAAVAIGPDDTLYSLSQCNVLRWENMRPVPLLSGACANSSDGPAATASLDQPRALTVTPEGVFVASYRRDLAVIQNGFLQSIPGLFPYGRLGLAQLQSSRDGKIFVTDYDVNFFETFYTVAYQLTGAGQKMISSTYVLPDFKEISPGLFELLGVARDRTPFATNRLWGITPLPDGRVVIGTDNPPGLLVYPEPR